MQSPGVHVEEQLWNTIIPQHAPTWYHFKHGQEPRAELAYAGIESQEHLAGLAGTYMQ